MAQQLLSEPQVVSRASAAEVAAFESSLKAMPSYELKAEYIVRTGKKWDDLPRPRLENAIGALVREFVGG